MSNIKIFENEEFGKIRTVVIDNELWFVGKDVAVALGYSNASKAVMMHVEDDDKTFAMMDIQADSQNGNEPVGQTKTALINESGVYSLVFSSKLESARRFKKWVTSEVLPAIRKTGGYVANDDLFIETYLSGASESTKQMFRNTLTAIRELNEKNKQLEQGIGIRDQQIAELKPKATYYDVVLQCDDLISISAIAKDYGKSARWMNKYLHDKKVQYRQGDIWLLYQKYAELGYTSTKTFQYEDGGENHAKVHTYWTQKGRLFIYDLMKNGGYLPLIEQNIKMEA